MRSSMPVLLLVSALLGLAVGFAVVWVMCSPTAPCVPGGVDESPDVTEIKRALAAGDEVSALTAVAYLTDQDHRIRDEAECALLWFPVATPRVEERLIGLLSHEEEGVRRSAVRVLSRMRSRRAGPYLFRMLLDESFAVRDLAAAALRFIYHEPFQAERGRLSSRGGWIQAYDWWLGKSAERNAR